MSRVHCLECGYQVVIDPRGLCPEGHDVGSSGARIEHAMGHEAVHPDEPEPWVYSIGTDEVTVPARPPAVGALLGSSNGRAQSAVARATGEVGHHDGTGDLVANGNGDGPAREARPMRAPGPTDDGTDDEAGDAESLLRELHSLAALEDSLADQGRSPRRAERNGHVTRRSPASSAAAPPPPPEDVRPPVPEGATPPPAPEHTTPAAPEHTTPPAAPEHATPAAPEQATPAAAEHATPARPTRGDPSAIADAFAELSALDVPTPARPGGGASGQAGTAPHGGAGGPRPVPPGLPTEHRDHPGAAVAGDDGGLSALFGEGPLFGRGGASEPAPGSSDELAGDRGGGDATQHEPTPEREYEATLHVVSSPRRSERSTRRRGQAPRPNGTSPQPAVPPPTPVRDREAEVPEDAGPTTNGHRVPTPDTGNALDLSSFTARGGPGGRKAGGRRRRLSR